MLFLGSLAAVGLGWLLQVAALIYIGHAWGYVPVYACLFLLVILGYIGRVLAIVPADWILPGDESSHKDEMWMVGLILSAGTVTGLAFLIALVPFIVQGAVWALPVFAAYFAFCGVLVAYAWVRVRRRFASEPAA